MKAGKEIMKVIHDYMAGKFNAIAEGHCAGLRAQ